MLLSHALENTLMALILMGGGGWLATTTASVAEAAMLEDVSVVVEGLCSPRKLTLSKEYLYIAESGIGAPEILTPPDIDPDEDICYPDPVFGTPSCLGSTSIVSRARVSSILDGGEVYHEDVVTGLFSQQAIVGPGEAQATGAQMVALDEENDETLFVVVGLALNGTQLALDSVNDKVGDYGAILKFEFEFENSGKKKSKAKKGSSGKDGIGPGGELSLWVFPWEDEFENDYDNSGDNPSGVFPVPNSNPYHLMISDNKFYVVDAGCNCIMVYERDEETGQETGDDPVVLVLDKVTGIPAVPSDAPGPCFGVNPPFGPPFCGQYQVDDEWFYDAEFVPTTVRFRPGHKDKIYVSALVGALWNVPSAHVFEYELDNKGFPLADTRKMLPSDPSWAIADFVFGEDPNVLYILETNPGSPFIPHTGLLKQVTLSDDDNESETVVLYEDLLFPSGIAVSSDGIIFISDNSYSLGNEDTCEGIIKAARLPASSQPKSGKKEKKEGKRKNL